MNQPELTNQQRDDLVAYLDGELDEEGSEQIEQLLARSETARREVDTLERTWDLLDVLPQVRASDTFSARTMSTIRVSESQTSAPAPRWSPLVRRGALAAACLLGLAGSAALGFYLAHEARGDRMEILVRDLPVIESLDVYREIQDPSFLRRLEESKLLDEESRLLDDESEFNPD
jgi:anti-sigma factor RsiW